MQDGLQAQQKCRKKRREFGRLPGPRDWPRAVLPENMVQSLAVAEKSPVDLIETVLSETLELTQEFARFELSQLHKADRALKGVLEAEGGT